MSDKPFSIPVVSDVSFGSGTQAEDNDFGYLTMPKGMSTYVEPILPDTDEIAYCPGAIQILNECLNSIDSYLVSGSQVLSTKATRLSLMELPEKDREIINQIFGEGEVAATIGQQSFDLNSFSEETGHFIKIQESVFAGVWRVLEYQCGQLTDDYVEVGQIPEVLLESAKEDSFKWTEPEVNTDLARKFINVGVLLTEIRDRSDNYLAAKQPGGEGGHTINLTLLPVSLEDISYLDYRLGTGRVTILSRGYGNCRITNTCFPNTWRVIYYNSQEVVILNSVEVVDLPEAALATSHDLRDSKERLSSILSLFGN